MKKVWNIAERVEEDIIRQLLHNRGLITQIAIEEFLHPDYQRAIDPFEFKQMNLAVDKIFKALENQDKIPKRMFLLLFLPTHPKFFY